MIEVRHHPAHDLVIHTATGPLTEAAFLAAARALYDLEPVPSLSFWDLSGADLAVFSLDRIRSVQRGLAPAHRDREGGRTAVLAPGDLTYATVRQYIAFSEALDLPFEQRVYRSAEAAWDWLGVDPDSLPDVPPRVVPDPSTP